MNLLNDLESKISIVWLRLFDATSKAFFKSRSSVTEGIGIGKNTLSQGYLPSLILFSQIFLS